MFERFTDRARRVVVLAQEEARMLGHNYIGTEHLLLGLLAEGDGLAAQALAALEVTPDAAREQIAEIIGEGSGTPTGHIPFTPRAKKVLELALREAQRLGDNSIDTEHILLGLVREGDGVGAHALVQLGATKDRVLSQVLLTKRDAPGEELRRVTVRQMPQVERTRPVNIREVLARLDEISGRLSAIENMLAGMQRPVARAPKPAPGGAGRPSVARRKSTGSAQRKSPAGGNEPPASTEPPASAGPPAAEA